jgi:hypothetical protein
MAFYRKESLNAQHLPNLTRSDSGSFADTVRHVAHDTNRAEGGWAQAGRTSHPRHVQSRLFAVDAQLYGHGLSIDLFRPEIKVWLVRLPFALCCAPSRPPEPCG